jgi:transcriptional regulator with PAS, ATPase and Fis domain
MKRLLVIAPYPGLRDLFLEVNRELGKDLHLEIGDRWKGVEIAKELESAGFDVIISRGATASLIRKHCRLPVVEVKISGYDILRTLTLVKGFQGKVGLMSYWNTIQGAEAIGSLLGMNMTYFPVKDEEEVEFLIREAMAQKVELMVGDVVSTLTANQFGMRTILINSGKEAVLESIQEADQMAFYTSRVQNRIDLLESTLNQLEDGLIALDHEGNIITSNEKGKNLLTLLTDERKGYPNQLKEFLSFGSVGQQPLKRTIRVELGGEEVELVTCPLGEKKCPQGVLFVIKSLVQREKRGGWLYEKKMALTHFNQLVSRSPRTQSSIEQGLALSESDCPLFIYGEPGTGKRSLAEAIHQAGHRKMSPFMVMLGERVTTDTWRRFMLRMPEERELLMGGTLYIEHTEKLPSDVQIAIMQSLIITNPLNIRMILSSHGSLSSLVKNGRLNHELSVHLFEREIHLSPLKDRREEIEEMIRWFIAAYNAKHAKQIAGCKDEVIQVLKDYSWPGNITELKRVTERACHSATGPFVQVKDIEDFLGQTNPAKTGVEPSTGIDLEGKTLKEIEREIILKVMEEEQQNQSQAAKRLGINRSTLWRKLKEE